MRSVDAMDQLDQRALDFFREFGFLKLPGFLDADTVTALEAEVRSGLGRSYQLPTDKPSVVTGYEGYYLPLMAEGNPVSRALTSGDRLLSLGRQLLGAPVMPKPAKGILYSDASGWHRDAAGPDLSAVKVAAYLSPVTAESGALRFVPGSHEQGFSDRLARFRDAHPEGSPLDEDAEAALWPGVPVPTEPGDIVVFDVHIWHAALFGSLRAQWSVSYVAVPETEAQRAAARDYIDLFLRVGHRYDRSAFPYYDPDWLVEDRPDFAHAMADLGLFDADRAGAGE
ncbi:phytanoyl-CoA dioxygenase family protein [Solihabitans fulvus]|uniref:Phytanoyl-CoA dioxygenase family protein n=1 Tax=Solihabitans fulvus TaxID=1892852 RepID=A0A5B2XLH4_9PSEU|nr:phytanoyl-CoA dioxygenase family protein [Solihabitans fulvus]KAA2264186.1 phytanoyl-CoA dioxygenase family protein [Solihabitans fulvus]